jgi:hypothetical protein
MARERVRRAELGLALLERLVGGASAPIMSPVGDPKAPGIPAERR